MNDAWRFEIPMGKMKLSSLKAKISWNLVICFSTAWMHKVNIH